MPKDPTTTAKAPMGRPKTDSSTHKKPRALSATDDEYERMKNNAKAAGKGLSEYFIDRCCF
jgi:hypothetical protein